VPFYVAGTVAAVNAVLAFIRLPETKIEVAPTSLSNRTTARVVSPELFRFAVVGFIATAGFAGFEATFSLFGERRFDLTEGSAAAVFLFVGALLVVVQGVLIGKLAARVHPFTLLRGALFVVAVGLFALSTATTWPVLFIALAVLAFGQGVATPSLTSLVAEAAPEDRRGEALGYQQSAGALARIAGPIAAGAVFDGVGVGAPYVMGGALVLVALGVVSSRRSSTSSVA
jgi:predicted MFS family arabinose efflux permease